MVTTRLMELRKRRGLMIALIAVNIGIPVVFLAVRLISHAVDPKSYGPAGGYSIFTSLVTGFMYIFGFIVAAVVGCTAGSVDLTEGMFRHLVITGRSRLALYLARIPAGLAIVIAMVADRLHDRLRGVRLRRPDAAQLRRRDRAAGALASGLGQLGRRPCRQGDLQLQLQRGPGEGPPPNVPCGNGQTSGPPPGAVIKTPKGTITVPASESPAQIRAFAVAVANQNYSDYRATFMVPSDLADGRRRPVDRARGDHRVHRRPRARLTMGQRTVPVILLIVLELILTPLFSRHIIAHLVNLERGIVGVAMVHIEPGGLPSPFGGGGPGGGGGGA